MTQAAQLIDNDTRELVEFRVGGQDFCIDITLVREIRSWTPATIVPHSPPYVLGVINLRGSVVPIVDLAQRLNLPGREFDGRHVIIIVVIEGQVIGLLVDAVSDILAKSQRTIQPTPEITSDTARDFVTGVIAHEDRMLRLLNLQALLPQARAMVE